MSELIRNKVDLIEYLTTKQSISEPLQSGYMCHLKLGKIFLLMSCKVSLSTRGLLTASISRVLEVEYMRHGYGVYINKERWIRLWRGRKSYLDRIEKESI